MATQETIDVRYRCGHSSGKAIGIAAEIFFIVLNMNGKKSEEKAPTIKIEIPTNKDSTTISIDTSHGKNIQLNVSDH